MKKTLIIFASLISLSSYASFNEVECEILTSGKDIRVEVEQPFPRTSITRQVRLTSVVNGAQSEFNYIVTSRRSPGFNQIQYLGAGFRLEVDHWPDNFPRWGRTYRGTMNSSDLFNNQTFTNLSCQFPNAQY